MKQPKLVVETTDGTYTRSLLASVLESRRAFVLPMRRAQNELLAGWSNHVPPDAGDISLDIRWLREPKCVRRMARKLAAEAAASAAAIKVEAPITTIAPSLVTNNAAIERHGLRLIPAEQMAVTQP